MTDLSFFSRNFKPKPHPPAEPPRQPVRNCRNWLEYRAARTRATSSPGPATDADAKGAWRFARDVMDNEIADVYYSEMRRGRR